MTKERLKKKAQALELFPGVYFMKDMLGNIIYIGKSKAIRNRVSSYFSGSRKPSKVERMVRSIYDFKVQYTDTELEALILECRLIKTHKPIYNRLLKQDHKYRYLYLNPQEARPRIKLVREHQEEGHYFGPYEKGQALYEAVQAINSFYSLPDCSWQEIKANCLTYKRGKCLGPCSAPYDEESLRNKLEEVQLFLRGEDDTIIRFYQQQMEEAAGSMAFEKALVYKETWQGLKTLHFKREAMQFAISQKVSVLKEDCPAGGSKLLLFIGTRLIWHRKLKEALSQREKQAVMKEAVNAYKLGRENTVQSLRKEEIDEAQIIFSWFTKQSAKNYTCLESGAADSRLEKALQTMLMTCE